VVAVFEDPDPNRRAFFIQMPFYQYGHLESWIATYAPRGRAVRRALADVLSALVYLHSQGIVHCDVKPPNILIAADERARLADFDISVDLKTRVSVRYAKNRSTCVGYTPGYEAPELLRCGASVATDMYAFGATLNLVREACLDVVEDDGDSSLNADSSLIAEPEEQDDAPGTPFQDPLEAGAAAPARAGGRGQGDRGGAEGGMASAGSNTPAAGGGRRDGGATARAQGHGQLLDILICKLMLPEARHRPSAAEVCTFHYTPQVQTPVCVCVFKFLVCVCVSVCLCVC